MSQNTAVILCGHHLYFKLTSSQPIGTFHTFPLHSIIWNTLKKQLICHSGTLHYLDHHYQSLPIIVNYISNYIILYYIIFSGLFWIIYLFIYFKMCEFQACGFY